MGRTGVCILFGIIECTPLQGVLVFVVIVGLMVIGFSVCWGVEGRGGVVCVWRMYWCYGGYCVGCVMGVLCCVGFVCKGRGLVWEWEVGWILMLVVVCV